MHKYKVIRNFKDGLGYHNPGDNVLMDENQAAPLLAIGCIEPAVQDITPQDQMTAIPQVHTDTMTAPQTGATMTARPDQGVQTPPTQQPAAQPTAETKPAEAQAPTQTATNQPTPEQIAHDVAEL